MPRRNRGKRIKAIGWLRRQGNPWCILGLWLCRGPHLVAPWPSREIFCIKVLYFLKTDMVNILNLFKLCRLHKKEKIKICIFQIVEIKSL
jgi:hypothetical protein